MIVKHVVEITVIDMENEELKRFILDGKKYIQENSSEEKTIPIEKPVEIKKPLKKYRPTKRSKNVVDTWIKEKKVFKFNFTEYFKDNPKQYYQRRRIEYYISKMVDDRTLTQVSNDTFIVNKKKNGGK